MFHHRVIYPSLSLQEHFTVSLTDEQQAVVDDPNSNKLVCALPGSGKTHTTISLAQRITEQPDARVLMVTFTRSSMNEMHNRIQKRLPPHQAKRVTVKTFAKIMLEQYRQMSQPRQLIIGPEFTNYIHRVARKFDVKYKEYGEIEQAIDMIGRSMDPDIERHDYYPLYDELQAMLERFNRIDLQTVCRQVTFALHDKTIKTLPFTHYVVDEFQDTDSLQYHWMLGLKSDDRYFTVVGDDDQAIYGWRGATGYQNMVRFQRDFKAKAFMLSQCYRCAPFILGAAQRLIEANENRIAKDMNSAKQVLGKVTTRIMPIGYRSPFTRQQEMLHPYEQKNVPPRIQNLNVDSYRYIVDCIEGNYKNLAILARTNLDLDALEYCLSERDIPTMRIGGKSIFDNPSVIGYVRLLVGFVFHKQRSALIDGLGWLGVHENDLYKLSSAPQSQDPLFDIAQASDTMLLHKLSELRNECVRNKPDAKVVTEQLALLLDVHFEIHNDPMRTRRMGAINTINNILTKKAGTFGERVNALNNSLKFVATSQSQDHQPEDRVVLCTMTGSKGLEWSRVLLMMLNHDVIPSIHTDLNNSEMIEEERRLLYVSMTRAEDELIMHFDEAVPSIFVEELGLI